MCLILDRFLWGHSSRVCDISCLKYALYLINIFLYFITSYIINLYIPDIERYIDFATPFIMGESFQDYS